MLTTCIRGNFPTSLSIRFWRLVLHTQEEKMFVLAIVAFAATASAAVDRKIDAPGCGQSYFKSDSRIVGGSEATPYSYPFICSLEYNGYHICGGSLVKNMAGTYYFVTAAHCVDRGARFYTMSCAVHDRFGSNPFRQSFTFSSVINHPAYSSVTFANDISVMVLSSQPSENNYLQPVCITVGDHTAGEIATVIGWGTTSEGGSTSNRLLEVQKPIVSDADCSSAYGSSFDPTTMVCAGNLGIGGADACQGDSGGPMVVQRNGNWELVGVVSWGYGCARPEYPGVYADVYSLKSWLSSVIN